MGVPVRILCLTALVLASACASELSPTVVGSAAEPTSTTRPPTTSSSTTTTAALTTTAAPTTTAPPPPVDVTTLRPPLPAGDPVGLASQIAAAEATIRTPGVSDGDLALAALTQQVAYRQLGDHADWDAAVLAALPAELHPTVQRHAAARREFMALSSKPVDKMPAWRIVAPEPAAQLVAWYQEAEAEFGIPWPYLAAINLVETGMGRIRGTSVAGAQGPMQFMPATWAAYGEGDVNDPRQAIRAAARYLQANGGPDDMGNALWNYNHSHHYVAGVQLYAELIADHPQAYGAFHHWGVWYRTTAGDIFLPVGYEATERMPADQYVATYGASR